MSSGGGLASALAAMHQGLVSQNARRHGDGDRHGANADARVMPAFGDNLGFLAGFGHGSARCLATSGECETITIETLSVISLLP